jgi:hypothetical protein
MVATSRMQIQEQRTPCFQAREASQNRRPEHEALHRNLVPVKSSALLSMASDSILDIKLSYTFMGGVEHSRELGLLGLLGSII